MSVPSVELAAITKRFGDVLAVDQVNLVVSKGEFFSFLGPSGCGKTTTLRLIAGLETPDSGDIYIDGERVNDLPPYERNVSTVFQRLALFPHLTVEENIAFGLKIQHRPREVIQKKVREILELVQLPGMEKRYPDQLSGGQQQRVALARSLVLEPAVLLLDEPLASLDRKLRKEMQVELRRIQREIGITFIYVTHDQKEALSMSDRVAVMKDGRVVQLGSPQDIYEHPKTKFVADFMGASNIFCGRVIEDKGCLYLQTPSQLMIRLPKEVNEISKDEAHLLALRPEDIKVFNEPSGYANCFPAKVLNKAYLGESMEMEVLLNGTERIKVHLESRSPAAQLPIGAEVFVGWETEAGSLVSDS